MSNYLIQFLANFGTRSKSNCILCLIALLFPINTSRANVISVSDRSLLSSDRQVDLDSNGVPEFAHGTSYLTNGFTTVAVWSLSFSAHVEFLFDSQGVISTLSKDTLVQDSMIQGQWSNGSFGSRSFGSSAQSFSGIWSAPFGDSQYANIAFRLQNGGNWNYGYLLLDLFQNQVGFDPPEAGPVTDISPPGWPVMQVIFASYESTPNTGISISQVPEPSVLILLIFGVSIIFLIRRAK